MSDQVTLLAGQRQSAESSAGVVACNDWLRMGPSRSLPKLYARYGKLPHNATPTRSLATLEAWSKRHGWAERADEYDARIDASKTEAANAAMHSGLALAHKRVVKLKRLAAFLEAQLYEQGAPDENGVRKYHNLWLPDVKQIGSGEFAERVDLEKFNGALVEQYRATMDDLAKETGGRVQKQQNAGLNVDLSQLDADQLERLAAGQDILTVLATPRASRDRTAPPAQPGNAE